MKDLDEIERIRAEFKKLRSRLNLSQQNAVEQGRSLGFSCNQRSVSNFERGRRPRAEYLRLYKMLVERWRTQVAALDAVDTQWHISAAWTGDSGASSSKGHEPLFGEAVPLRKRRPYAGPDHEMDAEIRSIATTFRMLGQEAAQRCGVRTGSANPAGQWIEDTRELLFDAFRVSVERGWREEAGLVRDLTSMVQRYASGDAADFDWEAFSDGCHRIAGLVQESSGRVPLSLPFLADGGQERFNKETKRARAADPSFEGEKNISWTSPSKHAVTSAGIELDLQMRRPQAQESVINSWLERINDKVKQTHDAAVKREADRSLEGELNIRSWTSPSGNVFTGADVELDLQMTRPQAQEWMNVRSEMRGIQGSNDGRGEIYPDLERTRAAIDLFFVNKGQSWRVADVTRGPRVSNFVLDTGNENEPAAAVKRFEDELSAWLGERKVRVVPPSPGMPWTGVDVPNLENVILRDFFDRGVLSADSQYLMLALGKDTASRPHYANLVTLPHLLIVGGAYHERMAFLRTVIASLLVAHGPDTLLMPSALTDTCRERPDSWQSQLGRIPHAIRYEPQKFRQSWSLEHFEAAVEDLLEKSYERRRCFNKAEANTIAEYNQIVKEESRHGKARSPMPRIVYVVEDMGHAARLVQEDMTPGIWTEYAEEPVLKPIPPQLESALVRLAQEGGQAGIHLVLATGSLPSNILTPGLQKSFRSRVAFKVSSAEESRIALDTEGAERLLGDGDALYRPVGQSAPSRIQTTHMSEGEFLRLLHSQK